MILFKRDLNAIRKGIPNRALNELEKHIFKKTRAKLKAEKDAQIVG